MFDNLDKLEIGDKFYIKALNKFLEYEVNKINVVLPNETESLIIQENKDLVTLVTCTPKHVNTHRLLVTGSRIVAKNEEQQIKDSQTPILENKKTIITIAYICVFIISLLVILFLFIKAIKSYKKYKF